MAADEGFGDFLWKFCLSIAPVMWKYTSSFTNKLFRKSGLPQLDDSNFEGMTV
jgi:hypothetical protein